MSTLATVQRLIAAEIDIDVESLEPLRPLDELGVDSLAIIEIMFKLEDQFGVRMPEERIPIRTVQDIADLVDRLVAERAARSQ